MRALYSSFWTVLALSPNNNEVIIYQVIDGREKRLEQVDVLTGHDLKVTSIDWAPISNRIVTCSAVSPINYPLSANLLIDRYCLIYAGSKRLCMDAGFRRKVETDFGFAPNQSSRHVCQVVAPR
jgi:hypothetical protein